MTKSFRLDTRKRCVVDPPSWLSIAPGQAVGSSNTYQTQILGPVGKNPVTPEFGMHANQPKQEFVTLIYSWMFSSILYFWKNIQKFADKILIHHTNVTPCTMVSGNQMGRHFGQVSKTNNISENNHKVLSRKLCKINFSSTALHPSVFGHMYVLYLFCSNLKYHDQIKYIN
jgi:hypothetical protein